MHKDFWGFGNYVFDFDGTLFDTAPDVLSALAQTLAHWGYPAAGLDSGLLGPPLENILQKLCPGLEPEKLEQMVKFFRKTYRESGFPLTVPYSGIPGLLAGLKGAGKNCYIATNKPRALARAILEAKACSGFFKHIVSCDSLPGKRIDKCAMLKLLEQDFGIAKGDGIMIGDTAEDIKAGKQAGFFTCAAAYGYGQREELLQNSPDFIAPLPDWSLVETAG